MNNKMVEMTLKRIVDIDENAVMLKNKIEEAQQAREKELKKLYRKMEFDVMRSVKKEAKAAYNKIIEEGKDIETKINAEKEEEIEELQRVIDLEMEDLVEELFGDIITRKN